MTAIRISGLLFLLAAVATAVSVMTRLSGSMEPLEGSPIQVPIILDAGQYIVAGAARTVSGLALVAAAVFLKLALRRDQPVAAGIAMTLLELSGAATAISGVAMLALAGGLPQAAEGTATLAAWDMPGWVGAVTGYVGLPERSGSRWPGWGSSRWGRYSGESAGCSRSARLRM